MRKRGGEMKERRRSRFIEQFRAVLCNILVWLCCSGVAVMLRDAACAAWCCVMMRDAA